MSDVIGTATLIVSGPVPRMARDVQRHLTGGSASRQGGEHLGRQTVAALTRFAGPLALAADAAAVVTVAAAFVGAAIKQAGGLEQSIGAIDVVFGDSSKQMHEWATGASTSVGLARDEYNQLSTLIGSQLKNAGTPLDQLAGKTNDLVTAGADMASMFGGTTAEAVEALSSALKGERDPIERYGVSLNQAKIDAKAAALGFEKVDGALSSEANAAATLALIMEQTGDAHGNFAKESGTYEGVLQRLQASWTNVTTTLGAGFLPIATAVASILLGMMPAVQGLADRFANFAPIVQGVISILKDGDFPGFAALGFEEDSSLVNFLFDLRNGVIDLFSAFEAGSANGVAEVFTGLINGAAGALAAVADFLPQVVLSAVQSYASIYPALVEIVWGAFVPALFSGAGAAIGTMVSMWPDVIRMYADALIQHGPILIQAGLTLFTGLVDALVVAVPQILAAVVGILPMLVTAITGMLPGIVTAALGLFMGLVQAVVTLIPVLLTSILELLPLLITTLLGMLPDLITAALTLFFGLVTGLLTALPEIIISLLAALPEIVATLLGMLPTLVTTAIDLFFGLVTGLLQMLPQLLTAIVSMLPQLVSTLVSLLPTLVTTAIELFSALITGVLQNIGPLLNVIVTQVIPGVIGAVLGAVPELLDAGVNLIGGLVDGLWQAAGSVGNALLDIIGGAVDGFLGFLGIHSPSRLAREQGALLAESWGIADPEVEMDGSFLEGAYTLVDSLAAGIASHGPDDFGPPAEITSNDPSLIAAVLDDYLR